MHGASYLDIEDVQSDFRALTQQVCMSNYAPLLPPNSY